MNKISTMILFMLISAVHVKAQVQNFRGGFGHGYFGTAANIAPDIQDDLSNESLLGNDLQLNRLGILGGGGGYGLFGKRILIGGSGTGFRVSDATSRGQATLSTGGGFINAGYVLMLRDNLLGFPYIGIGGNGMNLKIKNDSDESFAIGNRTVAPGESIKLNSGGISFEVGYSFQLFTFSLPEKGSQGGLMVGLQAGTYIFAGIEDWHVDSSDDMIPSFSQAYSFAPYIRFTVGGGGFNAVNKN